MYSVKCAETQCQIGQVWGHTPEQRVAASTLGRYSFGLRLTIAQVDARPAMPVSFPAMPHCIRRRKSNFDASVHSTVCVSHL